VTNVKFISRAALVFLLTAPSCLTGVEAIAQTQPQGMTVGSPPPPSPADKKAMRAKCDAQAKEKGLRGRGRRSFVDACMKG
jgi:hypothetical protein